MACGVRFWLPPGWTFQVTEGKSECGVKLLEAGWQRSEAESDYSIEFGVSVRKGKPTSPSDGSSDLWPGFYHDDRGWHADRGIPYSRAGEIEGPGWKGLAASIQYRSHDLDGQYQGVGEGRVATIVGTGDRLLRVEAHGGPSLMFGEVFCALEFVKSRNGI
jgi:hypothetical protein